MKTISLLAAWVGAAIIFSVVFFFDYKRYVMPDALSTANGTTLGTYLAAWLIYRLVKFKMGMRAPQNRYFILVAAVAINAIQIVMTLIK